MNTKGAMNMGQLLIVMLVGVGLLVGGFIFAQKYVQNTAFTAGTPSANGEIVVKTETINPTDTVTFTIVTKDKEQKATNQSYIAVEAKAIVDGKEFKSSQIVDSSTGGSVTSIPVSSKVTLFFRNTSTIYTQQYNSDIMASKSMAIDDYVTKFSSPNVQIRNVTTYPGVSGIANSLNMSGLVLTAGGSSEQFDIYLQAGTAYTKFGVDAIQVACSGLDKATYTVTSDMKEISLTNGMTGQDKKLALESNVKNVDTTLTKIGSISLQLNGGQTAKDINCSVYDKAPFLGIDGVSYKNGVELDDTSYTDNGAENGQFTFCAGAVC